MGTLVFRLSIIWESQRPLTRGNRGSVYSAKPPSKAMLWPVMQAACSEARKANR
jgi:hypothetical protein